MATLAVPLPRAIVPSSPPARVVATEACPREMACFVTGLQLTSEAVTERNIRFVVIKPQSVT